MAVKLSPMKKKPPSSRPPLRHPSQGEFRESDFAGMQPQDKTQLSGSLNRLSEQLANTRQLLQDIEKGASVVAPVAAVAPVVPVPPAAPMAPLTPLAPQPPGDPKAQAPAKSDDGTPVPP